MIPTRFFLVGASLALAAPFALSQSRAPGLWEQTMQTKGADGAMERAQAQMQQQLAALPPEQRKQFEQMMAQSNVKLGAQGMTVRICVTPAQAARPASPQMKGTDCSVRQLSSHGNTYRYAYACTQPTRITAESEVSFADEKSYTGTSIVTSETPAGPTRTTMQFSARWLGADCGTVKPLAQ